MSPTQPQSDVNDKTLREPKDWGLQSRTRGIGGGDAATILGVNPWMSPFKLFQLKTGAIPKETFDETKAYWGRVLEPIVSKHWMGETGRQLIDRAKKTRDPSKGRFDMRLHPDHDWMLANLDYEIADPKKKNTSKDYEKPPADGPGVYEGKTTSTYAKNDWAEDVPLMVQCQVQHSLACADMKWGSVAVFIGGQEFLWKDMERDDELIALMIEQEQEFWEGCLSGIPPVTDAHPATTEALKLLYPGTDGRIIDLSAAATKAAQQRLELLDERKALNAKLKELDAQLSGKANLIQVELGTATFGNLDDKSGRTVSWKLTKVPARDQKAYEFRVLRHHKK